MGLAQTYRLLAGAFVLVSTVLGIWVHPALLWVTLFVGAHLLQSGFTNCCPMMTVLRRAGLPG
jgi:hypothetical protein